MSVRAGARQISDDGHCAAAYVREFVEVHNVQLPAISENLSSLSKFTFENVTRERPRPCVLPVLPRR